VALAEQIEQDLQAALRAGDTAKVSLLRLLKSGLKNEQIKLGKELDEAAVMKVLQREAKQRKDSITAYQQAERPDLVEFEQAELKLIEDYLPQGMTEAELDELIASVIQEVGASSAKEMGVVIGAVMQRAGGRADGGAVAQKVRQQLNA
jgi:uncharacterized protein YqeY